MKRKYYVSNILLALFCMIILVIVVWAPNHVIAAGCYGDTCNGKNPNTMGCGSDARMGPQQPISGGVAQNRWSPTCYAEWERTINLSGGNRYAAGSIRYGCSNYCYARSVTSPALIANNEQVYTPMENEVQFTESCGRVSTSGPISIPIPYYVGSPECAGVG
jgi:hypothetical protein